MKLERDIPFPASVKVPDARRRVVALFFSSLKLGGTAGKRSQGQLCARLNQQVDVDAALADGGHERARVLVCLRQQTQTHLQCSPPWEITPLRQQRVRQVEAARTDINNTGATRQMRRRPL